MLHITSFTHSSSIIIPIRAKNKNDDSLKRLQRLVKTIPSFFEVIVVDDGSPRNVSLAIWNITKQHPCANYIRLSTRLRRFSLARSRNRGALAAKSPVVIFHDVDFIAMPEVYTRLADSIAERKLAQQPQRFFCVPVGFLTEEASHEFLKDLPESKRLDFWSKDLSNLESSGHLQHFVRGSSCIVMNREDLLAIGGHDESYVGHGAEDFELLHRLGMRHPIREWPVDYSVNTGSGSIKNYRGFRAYFALYGEQVLQEGLTFVHIYHPKRKGWGYYQHKRNFSKLKRLMESES